ncbi:MAG: 4-(cytidine 5'-diphospho)-2-C-methyl-D-erythritol kinase [Vulcanimicrobiaceae bacterium]
MISSRKLLAPAKINLTLEILRKREDGYHGLRSVMVPVGLCDEIDIGPSPSGFGFHCDQPQIASGDNLVLRAFHMLDVAHSQVRIELRKRIPVQAGLGGGSSDAAAILLAAMDGSFGAPEKRDWLAIARSLGSDVPFFLARTGALVEAAGERFTPVGALPDWWCVIVKPSVAVSTAQAFAWIDELDRSVTSRSSSISLRMNEALQRAQFEEVLALLQNDFHDVLVARSPEIANTITAMEHAGARHPMLSGSGSACFALAEHKDEAQRIADALNGSDIGSIFVAPFINDQSWKGAL